MSAGDPPVFFYPWPTYYFAPPPMYTISTPFEPTEDAKAWKERALAAERKVKALQKRLEGKRK